MKHTDLIKKLDLEQKCALLSGGTIADVGTHAELLARSALYREICESQEGGEDLG